MNEILASRYLAAKRRLFEKVVGEQLNDKQRDAVLSTEGPLLVLAGAGSGKTTVLVRRIAHIIKYGRGYESDFTPKNITEEQVKALEEAISLPSEEIEESILPEFIASPCPPWGMLAITFTNKAAKEIKERLAQAFDDEEISDQIWAGTFHSICLRILRKFAKEAGFSESFTIYDTDDKRILLSDIMRALSINEKMLPAKSVAAEISRFKDNLTDVNDVETHNVREADIKRVYAEYQKRLKQYNALDFDDIIFRTVRLLQNCEAARAWCQNKFHYVSVDEYQDTNPAQFRLSELLSDGKKNIMVVGDDDQSIYRFRGATVENILSFDTVYEDCKVIKLEQNYRSTKHILDAANAVISHNRERHSKKLWCAKGEGEKISLHTCENQYAEARYITDTITSCVVRNGRRYRDFAVLYRVNEMGRSLESGFARSGIPYRVLGTQRFYDRKEIKDMIAYLCLIENKADDGRLKRIINEPKRKLGAVAVDTAELIAQETGQSIFEVVRNAEAYPALSRCADAMISFANLIESFDTEETLPSKILSDIFERTGYKAMLEDEGDVAKVRIDSVGEFISAALEYEQKTDEPSLQEFLEEIELVADVDKYDENADAVVLMTIHSAKGLEFPVVFLPGMEEGIFPGTKAFSDPTELGEERRLAYVALTRAKEKIYISHTSERMLYGRTTMPRLSRFVADEIPENLLLCEKPPVGFAPPRTVYGSAHTTRRRPAESNRTYVSPMSAPAFSRAAPGAKTKEEGYGIERFAVGTAVRHSAFGEGEILSVKDLGGDILYEVKFDDGTTKKLMATFARLEKIEK